MAFNKRYLARQFVVLVKPGISYSHYNYGTEDALADVATAKYFNDAAGIVRPGDIIHVTSSAADGIKLSKLAVKSVIDGDVTTAALGAEESIDIVVAKAKAAQ